LERKFLMAIQLQEAAQTVPIMIILIVILLLMIIWLILRQQKPPRRPPIGYFVRDQVVITGLPDRIDEIRQQVEQELNIELRPVIEQPPPQAQVAENAADGRIITRLFHLVRRDSETEKLTAEDIADSINRRGELCQVMADANYKIGRSLVEVTGDPDSTEGFTLGEVVGVAPADAFYGQWALQSCASGVMGIELYDAQGNRTAATTGKGVLVAVFDTSPFRSNEVIFDPAIELTTSQQTAVTANALPGTPDARDHGLFVTSLIDAVAPQSEIQLIRVLDDSNRGTLAALVEAIQEFITAREAVAANPERPLAGTVINLSLGVHAAPDRNWAGPPIPTLYCVLKEAYDKGAVIVAASGNDSSKELQPAQLPAAYEFVIGVGASNSQGSRACFSNTGEIYAPGGDNDAKCHHAPSSCDEHDLACLIGAAHHTAPVSHFAYWKGTSFAAPLVTGLAALLVEQGLSPVTMKSHLLTKASLGSPPTAVPIINVRQTTTP
jgi:subtilisin family serine protease